MLVYHLGLNRYARQLTGEGAKLFGGRWNDVGHPCIYACESKALCALEYAANVQREQMPDDLAFTTYELPPDSWASFSPGDLPSNWQATPSPQSTQRWGTLHLPNHLALKIPSVIIPTEFNFLLNPLHPDFKKVRIKAVEPFTFDRRIKK